MNLSIDANFIFVFIVRLGSGNTQLRPIGEMTTHVSRRNVIQVKLHEASFTHIDKALFYLCYRNFWKCLL